MRLSAKDYAKAFVAATVDATRDEVRARAEALSALLRVRRQTGLTAAIVAEAERLQADRDSVAVTVTSEVALSSSEKKKLFESMGVDPGAVRLEERVVVGIGSGAKVQIGDRVVDATVSARLEALRKAFVG